jgi:hypothetical protein
MKESAKPSSFGPEIFAAIRLTASKGHNYRSIPLLLIARFPWFNYAQGPHFSSIMQSEMSRQKIGNPHRQSKKVKASLVGK